MSVIEKYDDNLYIISDGDDKKYCTLAVVNLISDNIN